MEREPLLYTDKVISWAKGFVSQVVKPGDTCVDATVGNGNDTLFLAELVGRTGKVFGFDIQSVAIKITGRKLKDNGLLDRVCLIRDSHAAMERYLEPEAVKAVMFNLGYLPGGDHSLTTLLGTTLQALEAALRLIKPGGLVTVVCYRGHEGALEEFHAVNAFLTELKPDLYQVLRLDLINRSKLPPVLFVIIKKAGRDYAHETARSRQSEKKVTGKPRDSQQGRIL